MLTRRFSTLLPILALASFGAACADDPAGAAVADGAAAESADVAFRSTAGDADGISDNACFNGAFADSDPMRAEACAMLEIINADRADFSEESDDAAPVQWSEDLWEVAIAHSRDMCEHGYFDHVNPDGEGPADRAMAIGLTFSGYAENLAGNQEIPAAQYDLMNEPTCTGHRANILDPRAFEVGIGVVECSNPALELGDTYILVTQNFYLDPAIEESPYCLDIATDCELPPDPPSTAVCGAEVISYDFCEAPDPDMPAGWDCPDD